MEVVKTSKDQAFLVTDSSKVQEKGKSKKKDPKLVDSKPKSISNLSKGPPALRRRNLKRIYVLIVKRDIILKNIV